MNNFSAAIRTIIEGLVELAPEGGALPAVEGIDIIPSDDGRDVTIRCHLEDRSLAGGLCVFAVVNLAEEFRERIELSIAAADAIRRALRSEPAA